MGELRDYQAWHEAYNDPGSGLSWRLRVVQGYLTQALERHRGPVRVVSMCAGDGRDLIGVLSQRSDSDRVAATLIELHPVIADQARARVAAAGLRHIEMRTADAGRTESYVGAVPADIVLMVGVFGNISDDDLARTIGAAPQFCSHQATLLWSRGRDRDDRNDDVRMWFAAAGFTELDYAERAGGSRPALGVMRYDGQPRPLPSGEQLFTFLR